MKADKKRIQGVKKLIEKGYTDKEIALVTKFSQSFINRIRSGKKHADVEYDPDVSLSKEESTRLNTLNQILALNEMWGVSVGENDLYYIHLLKFLGVSKQRVFELYAHLSKKHFNSLWLKSDVQIKLFDPTRLGISSYEYLDLIIDYFIK